MKKVGFIFISIFLIFIIWGFLFGPERYFIFNPYIDTKMSPFYSVDRFDNIKIGDSLLAAEEIIGKPLSIQISERNIKKYCYTNDAKLYNSNIPFFMSRDYAWYRSNLTFDTNNIVIKIDKGWSYD